MMDINSLIIERIEKLKGYRLYQNDKINFAQKFDELNIDDFITYFIKNPIYVSTNSNTSKNKITTEKLGKKEIKELHNFIKECIDNQVTKENEEENNKNSMYIDYDKSNRYNVVVSFTIFFFIVLIKHLIVNSLTS